MSHYLKWLATVILVFGTGVNALGYYPAGPAILTVGSAIWLSVSIMWKEPALIVTNAILTVVGLAGLLYTL
jgi:hypothetical protein